MLQKLKPKSEFGQNVVTLLTGTITAQAIPIAVSPILTRLYSPEDFGLFAIFSAIVMVLSVMASGRYDAAIMLAESERDAVNIFAAALLIISLFSLVVFIFIVVFYTFLMSITAVKSIGIYLYFVPFMIFLVSMYQLLYNWMNREKQYKQLALAKVGQTASTAFVNISMGLKAFHAFGLILGQIFGQFIATIYLFIKGNKQIVWQDINLVNMKEQLSKYSNFPKYDISASFLNVFSLQLPIFLLGFLFSPAIVGFFALSRRIIGLPVVVLSSSITTVFKQRAASDYNKYGNCSNIYNKTFRSLILISILPTIFLFLFAPELFLFIFGEKWLEAGKYTQILIPMFFLRFVSSPLSYIFYITRNQKLNMIGQGFLVFLSVIGLYAGYLFNSVTIGLILLSLSFSIIYAFYLYKSYQLSKGI